MLLAALCVLLPTRPRRFVMTRLLGYEIAPGARIGRAFVDVDRLRMSPGSWISGFTVIRGCDDVELAEDARIGHLVLVNGIRRGGRSFEGQDRHPAVLLGRRAAISTMHFIDATDELRVGEFSEIAGLGSQVLTHSFDFVRMRQIAAPVTIGHHCMIGTGVILLAGTAVPDCSIVSAGSAVGPSSVRDGHRVYSGVPAGPGQSLNPRMRYFHHADDLR